MFICLKYCSGRQSHTVFPVVGLLHPVGPLISPGGAEAPGGTLGSYTHPTHR